jgi:hypothetical protein
MIWLFASVVLYLAVVNAGFRKALLWFGGGLAGLFLLCAIIGQLT